MRTRTSRTDRIRSQCEPKNQKAFPILHNDSLVRKHPQVQNSNPEKRGFSIGFTNLELPHRLKDSFGLPRLNGEAWSGCKPWSVCPLSVPERSKAVAQNSWEWSLCGNRKTTSDGVSPTRNRGDSQKNEILFFPDSVGEMMISNVYWWCLEMVMFIYGIISWWYLLVISNIDT